MKKEIEELADKEAQMYAHCVMETELDRDWQHANIDYTNGFIAGYQKALGARPSWIDVNERLPNNLSEVIVHLKSGYVTTLNYGESNGFFNAMSNTNVSINNPVTHWMELPPFPNPIS